MRHDRESWSYDDRRQFDEAVEISAQAAACCLYGYHAESAHLWVMAASVAVTDSGRQACLDNARDELLLALSGMTLH